MSHQNICFGNGGACSLIPLPGAAVTACGSTWAVSALHGCSPGCRPTPAPGAEHTVGGIGKGKAELSPRCRGHPRGSPSRDESPHGRHIAPSAREAHPHHQQRRRPAKSGNSKDDGHSSTGSCLLHKSPRVFAFPRVVAAQTSQPPRITEAGQDPWGPIQPALGRGPCHTPIQPQGWGALSIPEDGPSTQTPPAPRLPARLLRRRLCRVSRQEQGEALAAALADTLWAAGGGGRAVICLVAAAVHVAPRGDYKADNFTERVSTKTPSANRIFLEDTCGLKFLKARNVKSHKPLP